MSELSEFAQQVSIHRKEGSTYQRHALADAATDHKDDDGKTPQFVALRTLVFEVLSRIKDGKEPNEIASRVIFGDGRIVPTEAGTDTSQSVGAAIVVIVRSEVLVEEDYAEAVTLLNELSVCHWEVRSYEQGEGQLIGIYVLDIAPEILVSSI